MLKNAFTFIFLFLYFAAHAQQANIELGIKEASLEEVILQLEEKYGYLFSYKEDDIKEINVLLKKEKTSIEGLLKIILKDKGLQYEIVNGNYIVLSKIKTPEKNISKNKIDKKTAPLICGAVIDSCTQKPLPYATVYLKKAEQGTYTSEDGKFSLRCGFDPGDTLVISYVGYQEQQFPATCFTQKDYPVVALDYAGFGEDFIVVTDYLTDGISLGDNGASTVLRPEIIGAMPGQAEPDIFNTLKFLPGINSPDGTASNLTVRGGATDQNLILWEDIPIYHAAHYFGMVSAFNPYISDKIKVYRGGFGAEYGGRVSSVIDMRTEGHTLPRSTYGAGVNFINAYAHGKMSFLENKASLVYSVRRSISDIWESPAYNKIKEKNEQGILQGNLDLSNLPHHINLTDNFDFFDTHIKGSWQVSAQDELNAAFFYANNNFEDFISNNIRREAQSDKLDLKTSGGSISWKHIWRKNISSKLTAVTTNYNYSYNSNIDRKPTDAPDKSRTKGNDVNERQLNFSTAYNTRQNHEFKIGLQLINYDLAYKLKIENNGLTPADQNGNFGTGLLALYADFNSAKEKKSGIDLGLRLNYYEKTKTNYIEPRLRLWHNISDELSLHATAGKYHQFLSQLVEFQGDNFGVEMPVWVLAGDDRVPVLSASQFQIGAVFNKKTWVVDIQTYLKHIDGLTSLATGFDPTPRQGFDIGSSDVRGIDILVKKRWKNFRTWFSYSLSKADYRFDTFFDAEFPAPYDQRHVFNWANIFSVGQFEISLGLEIATGRPYNLLNKFEVFTNPTGRLAAHPVVSEYYTENLPLQHHLDASFLYKIEPKGKQKFRTLIGLSFYNIYGQKNIYSREYFVDIRPDVTPHISFSDKAGLGFTPNAVLRFEW